MYRTHRARQGGFTLIELMITVGIIGLMAAIAYPSYTSYVRKGARRAAQAQMLDIANRQQQFLLANRAYADLTALQTSGYNLPADVGNRYDASITVGSATVPAFTITFTAKNAQLVDGNLTFNSEGVKGCGTGCDPSTKW